MSIKLPDNLNTCLDSSWKVNWVEGINWWIKSLDDFFNRFSVSNWPNCHNYYNMSCFFNKLKVHLRDKNHFITNPVEYLAYLYYYKIKGTSTIFKEIWNLSHYSDYTKLWHLFTDTLWWTLRENTYMSVPKIENNNKKLEIQRQNFKNVLFWLLDSKTDFNTIWKKFDLDTYNSTKKTKICKLKYLFCYLMSLDEDEFVWYLFKMYNKWVWPTMIASELNIFADNMWYWLLIKADKDLVMRLLEI